MEKSDRPRESSVLILDACCAINLLASKVAEDILDSLDEDVAVARLVLEQEVLRVRVGGTGEVDGREKTSTSVDEDEHTAEGMAPEEGSEMTLEPLVEQGLLQVLSPASQEQSTYVDLALQLDEGEAMTGALAIHRGAVVATDDRKAIRVLRERDPSLEIVRTSELMKIWSDVSGVPDPEVCKALKNIENWASFMPPVDDPMREWWFGMCP